VGLDELSGREAALEFDAWHPDWNLGRWTPHPFSRRNSSTQKMRNHWNTLSGQDLSIHFAGPWATSRERSPPAVRSSSSLRWNSSELKRRTGRPWPSPSQKQSNS